jgi:hypothetical protein
MNPWNKEYVRGFNLMELIGINAGTANFQLDYAYFYIFKDLSYKINWANGKIGLGYIHPLELTHLDVDLYLTTKKIVLHLNGTAHDMYLSTDGWKLRSC